MTKLELLECPEPSVDELTTSDVGSNVNVKSSYWKTGKSVLILAGCTFAVMASCMHIQQSAVDLARDRMAVQWSRHIY